MKLNNLKRTTPRDLVDKHMLPLGHVLDANGVPHVLIAVAPTLNLIHIASNLRDNRDKASWMRSIAHKLLSHADELDRAPATKLIVPPGALKS